ncbi:MAG: hypothetical protein WCY16_03970 [Weeksellaceae bacterium]
MIKFKTVKPSVVGGRRKRTVNVNKTGAFFFSARTLEDAGLKPGDRIDFLFDENRPSDWYFTKREGAALELSKNNGIYSASIRGQLIKSLELDEDENYSFKIGEKTEQDGNTYWPIITANLKKE